MPQRKKHSVRSTLERAHEVARSIPEGHEALNAIAWRDCCLWAFGEPAIRKRFKDEAGIDLDTGSLSPIGRLVDDATGKKPADLNAFVAWFNREIWGEDMVPEP